MFVDKGKKEKNDLRSGMEMPKAGGLSKMLKEEKPAPSAPAPVAKAEIKQVPLIDEKLWNDPDAPLAAKIEGAIDSKI